MRLFVSYSSKDSTSAKPLIRDLETTRHAVWVLVAAAAKEAGLTVLHYDGDFDLVASVTGQACEWIVPAGTAD